jgi:hypothetical protein
MAPHAEFRQVPPDLVFLHGDVDLGFENLKLPIQQQNAIRIAFEGVGVAVPGTGHKLRRLPNSSVAVVEPASGKEPMLPVHWKRGACTLAGNVYTYVGKDVRRNDQLPPGFEPAADSGYKDIGDGHIKV